MKGRRKKAPAAPPSDAAAATPFFARFLESQKPEDDAEAKVSSPPGRAQATAKKTGSAKKGSSKKRGGATKGAAAAVLQTLKYPSDRDEWVFFPYHVEAARIGPGSGPQTMKAPSDGDELPSFAVFYVDRKDAPPASTTKARAKEARVKITIPSKDIHEAG